MASIDWATESMHRAMERSVEVGMIATFSPALIFAPSDVDAATWLTLTDQGVDQFPVLESRSTIGVLSRHAVTPGQTVAQAMRPLSEELIVAADTPIVELIPLLRGHYFRLVLRGGRIDGIVTQSDVLKLPVRQMLFGKITRLELSIRRLIQETLAWPDWLEELENGSARRIRREYDKLRQSSFEPDPLELTTLQDVVILAGKRNTFGDQFRGEMDAIRTLRNQVAHSKTFISSPKEYDKFADVFEQVEFWQRWIWDRLK